MSTPMSTVTSTLAMVRAAEARGVDPSETLARHGVTGAALLSPDNQIRMAVELAIWDELRERTGKPALQLFAPGELPVGTYHVVEYLLGASATVGDSRWPNGPSASAWTVVPPVVTTACGTGARVAASRTRPLRFGRSTAIGPRRGR